MRNLSVLTILFALSLTMTPVAPAAAYEADDRDSTNVGLAILDGVLVRPVMLGVSLATTGLYLGTLPLTFLTDVDEEAGDVLVYKPWWFTSGREAGHFTQRRP